MTEFATGASQFMAHGHCFLWTPPLLWTYVIADAVIVLSYFSIPLGLLYFAAWRRDLEFKWLLVMFGLFIAACGVTHFLGIVVIWKPLYWVDAGAKVVTAVLAASTAFVFWPIIPTLLTVPSPSHLMSINRSLEQEVKLRERLEETFKKVVEAIPAGTVLVNRNGVILLVNRHAEVMFGYSRQQMVGQALEMLLPERYRARHRELMQGVEWGPLSRTMSAGREIVGLRSDDTEFPAEVGLNRIDTDDGPAMLATVVDISERKQAERHKALLAAVVEGTEDAIITVDREGVITSWNLGAQSLLGYSAEEAIGVCMSSLIPADELPRQVEIMARVSGGDQIDHYETRRIRKDGAEIDLSLTISPLRGIDGKVIGASKIARDITDRKRLETELLLHRDHLTELVAAQVKDVVAAKQEAERANQSKSLFLANMSHELRTPLHAILGFSKLALEKPDLDPAVARNHFSRIAESGERLLALLDDLLDLSKLEAGKLELEVVSTDVRAVAESVIRELVPLAQAKRLKIELQCNAKNACAEIDSKRIAQVIRNVLANAVRFSPEDGTILVQLESTRMAHGRRRNDRAKVAALTLAILDQGPGIPEAELEQIFDNFYQSSRTRTEAGGTGLGLAICREIIQLHHGTIGASNRPDGGAAIAFQIPRKILDTLERLHV